MCKQAQASRSCAEVRVRALTGCPGVAVAGGSQVPALIGCAPALAREVSNSSQAVHKGTGGVVHQGVAGASGTEAKYPLRWPPLPLLFIRPLCCCDCHIVLFAGAVPPRRSRLCFYLNSSARRPRELSPHSLLGAPQSTLHSADSRFHAHVYSRQWQLLSDTEDRAFRALILCLPACPTSSSIAALHDECAAWPQRPLPRLNRQHRLVTPHSLPKPPGHQRSLLAEHLPKRPWHHPAGLCPQQHCYGRWNVGPDDSRTTTRG